jgi:hypothetical protein
MALRGEPFMRSSYHTFFLMTRNRNPKINSQIANIIYIAGRTFIVTFCGLMTFMIVEFTHNKVFTYSYFPPVLVVSLFAHFVSSIFFSRFSFSSRALIHVFFFIYENEQSDTRLNMPKEFK